MKYLSHGIASAMLMVLGSVAFPAMADTITTFNVFDRVTSPFTDTIGGTLVVDTTIGTVVASNVTDTGVQTGATTFLPPDTFGRVVSINATNGKNVAVLLQDTGSKNYIQLAFSTASSPGSLVDLTGPGTGVYEIDDKSGNYLEGTGGLTVTAAAMVPPGGGSNAVPEPSAFLLLATSLFALGFSSRLASA